MTENTTNELLMTAVAHHDVTAVKLHLANGADPNYCRFRDEDEPDGIIQPTTPLRLVVFCISDALLNDDDIKEFAEVAKILLKHGADPKPAMEIAEERYGKYDPSAQKNPFVTVLDIIANAE